MESWKSMKFELVHYLIGNELTMVAPHPAIVAVATNSSTSSYRIAFAVGPKTIGLSIYSKSFQINIPYCK